MGIILYVLCSLIWFSVFYAFMQNNKPDVGYRNNYWNNQECWTEGCIVLCIIGIFFWWACVLVIIFIKLANKYLFNK